MLKIKTEFIDRVIGYNGSVLPLGQRKDLKELAIMAVRSKNPKLIEVFEHLPTLEQLLEDKTKQLIHTHKTTANASEAKTNPTDIKDGENATTKE